MIKEENLYDIVNQLGLSPADYPHKNLMERYLRSFWNRRKEFAGEDEFRKSLAMALYVLDGIKDASKVELVDSPNFTYEGEFYTISSYQSSWKGSYAKLHGTTEQGIMHEQIKDLIDELNEDDITRIFILDLFSARIESGGIGTFDYKDEIEIRFLSRFLVEKKDEGIKLLESNGL